MIGIALLKPPPSAAERHRATPGSVTPGVTCVIALVLLGFGIAHVIGATIMVRGEEGHRSPSTMVAVHTD